VFKRRYKGNTTCWNGDKTFEHTRSFVLDKIPVVNDVYVDSYTCSNPIDCEEMACIYDRID